MCMHAQSPPEKSIQVEEQWSGINRRYVSSTEGGKSARADVPIERGTGMKNSVKLEPDRTGIAGKGLHQ
jgi:hypothetical protein